MKITHLGIKVDLEMINNWVQSEPVNVVSSILNIYRTWGDGMTPAFLMRFNLNFIYYICIFCLWQWVGAGEPAQVLGMLDKLSPTELYFHPSYSIFLVHKFFV